MTYLTIMKKKVQGHVRNKILYLRNADDFETWERMEENADRHLTYGKIYVLNALVLASLDLANSLLPQVAFLKM